MVSHFNCRVCFVFLELANWVILDPGYSKMNFVNALVITN